MVFEVFFIELFRAGRTLELDAEKCLSLAVRQPGPETCRCFDRDFWRNLKACLALPAYRDRT
jgi:hypothetical protein